MNVLKVISDVVCPWCYIGKHRLEQALENLPGAKIEVRWLPFELNPGLPPEGMAREDYCVRKFGSLEYAKRLYDNIAATARADGLEINLDKISRTPSTKLAHRLIWYAEKYDLADAMLSKLFEAYFVDGVDIGSDQRLADLASEIGLEHKNVMQFLDGEEGVREVHALTEYAYDSGTQGVPAFMWGEQWLFAGAQSPETIAMVIEKQRATKPS